MTVHTKARRRVGFVQLQDRGVSNKPSFNNFRSLVNAFVFDVLGLKNEELNAANNDRLDGVLQLLIDMRMEARANKDFALSDKIRDELLALGIQLKDGKEGTSYSLN